MTLHPGIDVLSAIASALNVPIANLILAYQGKDPDKQPPKEGTSPYRDAVKAFVKALPDEEIAAIISAKGKEILVKQGKEILAELDEMDKQDE